jgi:hypothetical protein
MPRGAAGRQMCLTSMVCRLRLHNMQSVALPTFDPDACNAECQPNTAYDQEFRSTKAGSDWLLLAAALRMLNS